MKHLLILLLLASPLIASAQTTASGGIVQSASNTNLRLRTYNSPDRVIIPYNGTYAGFVGIGISPTEKLHVSGNARANDFNATNGVYNSLNSTALYLRTNGTNRLTILNSNGNVGIGTSSPGYNLDVVGTINATSLRMGGATVVSSQWVTSGLHINYTAGMVSIGTPASPVGYKLAVGGKIVAEEVVVKLQTAWPDYVFADEYKLLSLLEVERFIKQNKHLPGVPSATQVEADGISLGEMNATLLKKIEELTLYMIELKKENEQQQKLIEALLKDKK